MIINKKVLLTCGVSLLIGTTSLFGMEKTANNILANSYKYMGSLDKVSFKAVITENNHLMRHDVSVKMDRPNKLVVDTHGEFRNRTNYLYNGVYTMFDHNNLVYGEIDTPKDINNALDFLFQGFDINPPLSSVIYSDMVDRMNIKDGKYFGTKLINNIECDYIAFRKKGFTIHAWISTGEKPLVQTYSIINGDERLNTSFVWNNNNKMNDTDFIFNKNGTKINVSSNK